MTSDTATEPGTAVSGASASGATRAARPTAWQRRLRRFGHVEYPRTPLRDRLVPPFRNPGEGRAWQTLRLGPAAVRRLAQWSGWGGPVFVALFAGVLRFWQLGGPRAVIFDETYYAKDAWSLWHFGYEASWPDNANAQILATPQRIPVSPDPSYVVHPPVGKWIIGFGEWIFGLNPFGWRFMTALLGTLAVLMLCRIGRRLFRSTALGCLAGGLMAVDGLEFVMSRTALLDLIVMFWVAPKSISPTVIPRLTTTVCVAL